MKKFFKLFSIMLMTFLTTNVLAYQQENIGNFTVQYDAFAQSEVVNARLLKTLTLSNASDKIYSDNFRIEQFSFDYNPNPNATTSIFYYGPLNIADTNGGTVVNNLSDTLKFRWDDAILLSNGEKADLEIIVSDITAVIETANTNNEKIAAMKSQYTNYYVPLISHGIGAIADKVGVSLDNGSGIGGRAAGHTVLSYGETMGPNSDGKIVTTSEDVRLNERTRFKFQIKAYKAGSNYNTPLDGDYKILFGAYDLDVASNITTDSSLDEYGKLKAKLQDEYTEGVELVSGFGTIHSGYKNYNENYGTSNMYYLKDGRLRISPNYNNVENLYYKYVNDVKTYSNGLYSKYDQNYLSGFLTSASISGEGSTMYWTGSTKCGTTLFNNFEVNIEQKHNNGGTVSVSSNIDSTNKLLENTTKEDYFAGSEITYKFNANKGYYVKNLLVNGEEKDFTSGNYKFDNFNFIPKMGSPIESSQQIGQTVSTQSIEVQFAPYNFELHYLHEDKSEDENLMPHKDLSFDEEGKLAKNKYEKENYVFYRWKVLDENKEEILDNNGKPILLKNEEDLSKIYDLDVNFDGGKVYLQAQFTEKSILNPKTYDSNSFLFIIITFISFGGIVTLLVKNSKKLKKSN